MTLATLAEVKPKLGLNLTDTALDLAIQNVLDAADAYVRGETGFDDAATTRTETFTDVDTDDRLRTKFRPIDPATAVTAAARAYGETVTAAVTVDVIDPVAGELRLILGSGSLIGITSDVYDVVQITYKTLAATGVRDLVDAIAELAAYWFHEHRANAASVSVGIVSEDYINKPLPPSVAAVIWRYKREIARWA